MARLASGAVSAPKAFASFSAFEAHLEALTVTFEASRLFAGAALSVSLSLSAKLCLGLECVRISLLYFVSGLVYFFFMGSVVGATNAAALRTAALAVCEALTVELDTLGF